MTDSVFEQIYSVVKAFQRARIVGYALHCNRDPSDIPCYRVVNREGRVPSAFVFGVKNLTSV